jgi:type I restriction enzyme S subunit
MKSVILSEICEIGSGGTPSRNNPDYYKGNIPWAKISDIENAENGIIWDTAEKISIDGLKSIRNKIFSKGTLLFAMYGSIGKVAIAGIQISSNQAILGIRPKNSNQINIQYLKCWFERNKQKLINQGRGVALQNLSATIIRGLEIPLPPLDDQIRIASLLSKVENIISRRREQLKQLDELLKSVFLEMFGDPVRNEKGWEMKRMDDISDSRLGKMRDKKFITGNHLRKYIGNSNVQWFRFKLDDLEQMDFDKKERALFGLKDGDLLICEGGDIGRCAIWRNNLTECYFQKAIHRVRLQKSQAIPEYVQYVMMFFSLYNGFKNVTCKATIAHLTGEKLKETLIPLPTLEHQNRFAAIVTKVEFVKDHYIKSLNKLEFLYNTVSQKAFKGELDLSQVPIVDVL